MPAKQVSCGGKKGKGYIHNKNSDVCRELFSAMPALKCPLTAWTFILPESATAAIFL